MTWVRTTVGIIMAARIGERVVGVARAGVSFVNVEAENRGFTLPRGSRKTCNLGNHQCTQGCETEMDCAVDLRVVAASDYLGVCLGTATKQGGKID